MKKFAEKIRRLKESLFGNKQDPPENGLSHNVKSETDPPASDVNQRKIAAELDETKSRVPKSESDKINFDFADQHSDRPNKRAPYYIQIGFDFGTAYAKCICRDVNTNEAWVYVSPRFAGHEMACLYPSLLKFKDNVVSYTAEPGLHYKDERLYHLKWALKEAASGQWDSQVLKYYGETSGLRNNKDLVQFVKSCAIYFLAATLGEIRGNLIRLFNDFGKHPDDYMAVNLGIPVAFAEKTELRDFYYEILYDSWGLADKLAGHPSIKYEDLKGLCDERKFQFDDSIQDACFLVPEVSANLQGFVKSRVSMPGTYLFSDTGAATVDQCIFTFTRKKYEEKLNYLHADVLPLGSSQIEFIAASKDTDNGQSQCDLLEKWRSCKENGADEFELKYACRQIAEKLSFHTQRNLAISRKKLFCHDQLEDTKIIFGGGGHCDNPYKEAVLSPFLNPVIFTKSINPSIIGVPKPTDLSLHDRRNHWMSRLSVAYGLSFNKFDLAQYLFPSEIENPTPDKIWQPQASKKMAPTKDEC